MKLKNLERLYTLLQTIVAVALIGFSAYAIITHSRSRNFYETAYADVKINEFVNHALSSGNEADALSSEYKKLRDRCLLYIDNTTMVSKAFIYITITFLVWGYVTRNLIRRISVSREDEGG